MAGKLRVIVVVIVLGVLLMPSLVLAQDTGGDERCVFVENPTRTSLGIIGPEVIVGGVRDFHFTGPRIFFAEGSQGPVVLLPAVQYPPDPC
jgi:hypothetical protein